jgi:hypothetical protein
MHRRKQFCTYIQGLDRKVDCSQSIRLSNIFFSRGRERSGCFQVKIHFSIERWFERRWHCYLGSRFVNIFSNFRFFLCICFGSFISVFFLIKLCVDYVYISSLYFFLSFLCSSLAWHRITSSQSVSRCSQQTEEIFLCNEYVKRFRVLHDERVKSRYQDQMSDIIWVNAI